MNRTSRVTVSLMMKIQCRFYLLWTMMMDTRYSILVSEAVYKEKMQHLTLRVTKLKLRTYTGEATPVLGVVDVTVEHKKQKKILPLYIIQGNHSALLGCR